MIKKKFKFQIVWLGPLVNTKRITNWKAASPAAIKWQKHLIASLVKLGIDIEWIYYIPDSYWPKGRIFPTDNTIFSDINYKCTKLNYLNVFGLRNITKKIFLKKILLKIKKKHNEAYPLIIISYNAPDWTNDVYLNKKISKDFLRIYLLADDKVPKIGDGYIFLSYYNYKKYKRTNKLLLDGAIYPNDKKINLKNKKNKKIYFFYSGSMHKWGGVNLLLETMKLIKQVNFELWISGPGNPKFVKKAIRNDNRIKYLGLLNDTELKYAYKQSSVFLNPRPIKVPRGEFNFPSKLFDYLAWRKPIISTWTKGLSQEYKKILHISKDNPKDFAKAMIYYMNKNIKNIKINKKFLKKKNWKNQALRLNLFLDKIVRKKNIS